jgi:hypothetical protein
MADRGSLKPDQQLCAELKRLATEYRYSDTEFVDILLEYVLRDIDRVDAAVDERRQDGSRKARQRRSPGTTLKAAPESTSEAEPVGGAQA